MTTQLTISNPGLRCDMIIRQLQKMQMDANVIEGKCLVENALENSCQITFSKKLGEEPMKPILKNTWSALKKDNGLTCAHLKISGKYSGCVLDYFQPRLIMPRWNKIKS